MRTLYVKKEFFERLGVENPDVYYKAALEQYRGKFANNALKASIEFVKSFNGFNWITKPLWRSILKAEV